MNTLLFVIILGIAKAAVINIDTEVDKQIDEINNFNKFNNYTTKSIPDGSISQNVSYY